MVLVGLGGASASPGLELVREALLRARLPLSRLEPDPRLDSADPRPRGLRRLPPRPGPPAFARARPVAALPQSPIHRHRLRTSPRAPAPLWFDGIEVSQRSPGRGFCSACLAVPRPRGAAASVGDSASAGAPSCSCSPGAGVYPRPRERWNSWDLLTQPGQRLAELHAHVADPAGLAKAITAALWVAILLLASYLVFYLLMDARIQSTWTDAASRWAYACASDGGHCFRGRARDCAGPSTS